MGMGNGKVAEGSLSVAVRKSKRFWLLCFLAISFVFLFGFLDESITLPWAMVSQDGLNLIPDQLQPQLDSSAQPWPQCLSKTQHSSYLDASRLFPMSQKLQQRLQRYEAMHHRCTDGRDWEEELGNPGNTQSESKEAACQYIFFMEAGGLGNRLLGLMSAFVYSLLTDRAILLSRSSAISQLLCNPFPSSAWIVPDKFPQRKLLKAQEPLQDWSDQDFSNITVVKLKQQHGQTAAHRRFYCTGTQEKLATVKWVTFDSNQYMIPRFFTMPYFWTSMQELFGDDPTLIFTQLSRYILLPKNFVWDRILRVYWTYMADATKRVGVQIRRHSTNFLFDQQAYKTVMQCLVENHILPDTTHPPPPLNFTSSLHRLSDHLQSVRLGGDRHFSALLRRLPLPGTYTTTPQNAAADLAQARPISVLIASLNREYYDEMVSQYSSNPTADGSLLRIHQMSWDKKQSFNFSQLVDAFTEMWLLGLSDVIASSGWSTFGYVGHGIGGLKPFVINLKGSRHKAGETVCWRPGTREPCCHFPFLESVCIDHATNKTEAGMGPDQTAWAGRHIVTCLDELHGIQLVQQQPSQQ